MDKVVAELLTHLGTLGYAIVILIFACPLGYNLYKFLSNRKKEYDETVKNKMEHDKEYEGLVDQMTEIVAAINQVQGTVETVASQSIELQGQFATEIRNLNKKIDSNHEESVNGDKRIADDIKSHDRSLSEIERKMDRTDSKLNLLIDSNKESNKAIITNIYYEHVGEKGYIPVFKLQSVEAVYKKYLEENGDTFVEKLMDELRALPHESREKKDE